MSETITTLFNIRLITYRFLMCQRKYNILHILLGLQVKMSTSNWESKSLISSCFTQFAPALDIPNSPLLDNKESFLHFYMLV